MATRLPTGSRNAAADAIVDRLDTGAAAGTVDVRTGAQPAAADDAATGTLLVTFTLSDPAFGAAASGTAIAAAIATASAVAGGTAGWFRAKDSNGNGVLDGSVTATGGGGDMELDNTSIASGQDVSISSWTATMPAG